MVNPITDARTDLLNTLEGTTTYTYDGWIERLNTPCLVVAPDTPYVVLGERYGEKEIRLRVFMVVKHSASLSKANSDLDALIDKTLDTLSETYATGEVEQPEAFTIGNTNYLGTSLQITIERSSTQ